jgi:hypothetical protein
MVAGPPTSLTFHVASSGPGDAGAARDHGTVEVGAADAIKNASPTFGPVTSVEAPPTMTILLGYA